MMSVHFNLELSRYTHNFGSAGVFDGRAFNIPENDVPNYFIWRYKDCLRNSLQMYCQSFFSPKGLHGKGWSDQQEMLYKIGKNWSTDLTWKQKNGTFIFPGGNVSDNLLGGPDAYDINYSVIASWISKNPFEREVKDG
jgi:tRNA(His) 5'-end guanylyltransferase